MTDNDNIEDAFTDAPPCIAGVQLRAFDSRVAHLVARALERCADSGDLVAIGAYLLAAGEEPLAAVRALRAENVQERCEARALEVSECAFGEVQRYLERVMARRALAAVEVAQEPGK